MDETEVEEAVLNEAMDGSSADIAQTSVKATATLNIHQARAQCAYTQCTFRVAFVLFPNIITRPKEADGRCFSYL